MMWGLRRGLEEVLRASWAVLGASWALGGRLGGVLVVSGNAWER